MRKENIYSKKKSSVSVLSVRISTCLVRLQWLVLSKLFELIASLASRCSETVDVEFFSLLQGKEFPSTAVLPSEVLHVLAAFQRASTLLTCLSQPNSERLEKVEESLLGHTKFLQLLTAEFMSSLQQDNELAGILQRLCRHLISPNELVVHMSDIFISSFLSRLLFSRRETLSDQSRWHFLLVLRSHLSRGPREVDRFLSSLTQVKLVFPCLVEAVVSCSSHHTVGTHGAKSSTILLDILLNLLLHSRTTLVISRDLFLRLLSLCVELDKEQVSESFKLILRILTVCLRKSPDLSTLVEQEEDALTSLARIMKSENASRATPSSAMREEEEAACPACSCHPCSLEAMQLLEALHIFNRVIAQVSQDHVDLVKSLTRKLTCPSFQCRATAIRVLAALVRCYGAVKRLVQKWPRLLR